MPKKEKRYPRAKFPPEIIKKARDILVEYIEEQYVQHYKQGSNRKTRSGLETWTFDNDEEFFAEYRKDIDFATIWYWPGELPHINLMFDKINSEITVQAQERYQVERVFEVFEEAYTSAKAPEPAPAPRAPAKPTVFIGHGRSPMWRELADHLTYLQNFDIEAYETAARAGLSVVEVLQIMLNRASFAVLVHTAEDEQHDHSMRARENVVHETGLFQGRLGFNRAIVLREEGSEPFSNQSGITEIRFTTGRIRETFGELVATLFREFPAPS